MKAIFRHQEPSPLLQVFLTFVREEASSLSAVAHAA
jgi:hypothetical protein